MGQRRILVLKLIALVAIGLSLYYILFPGLFLFNFSEGVIMVSIMLRLGDLWRAAGFEIFSDTINTLSFIYRPDYQFIVNEAEDYSSIATLLKSDMMIVWLSMAIFGFLLYLYRIRNVKFRIWKIYLITLFVCILTQFGVQFLTSNAFQLIVGFALFPLFNKMWKHYSYYLRIIK